MSPSGADPVAVLRSLLAAGRYQDVLDYSLPGGNDSSPEPGVALAVATAATRLGRFGEAVDLADSAIAIFRRRGDDDGRLRAVNLLGAIHYERGQIEEATEYWRQAIDLARALADTTMVGRTSNNLAIVQYYTGEVDQAKSGYREAMLSYQRLGDRRGVAEALHNLAIIVRAEGSLKEAAALGEEAVRHAESVGDPVLLGLMLIGRAETLVASGDGPFAEGLLARAQRMCADAGDELGQAEIKRVLAELRLRENDPVSAFESASAGRVTAEQHGSRLLEGECAALAGHALRQLGREDESRRFFDEARSIFTSLGAVLWLQRLPD